MITTETKAVERLSGSAELVIHTEDLSKAFAGETAVDQLTLDVPPGVIFGFIGPSGCGKTTTVRLLLGIYKPTSGTASVLNCNPQAFSRREQESIGYMPQLFVLYQELTVWENLNFAASLYGVPWRRKSRLHDLLELVELKGHQDKLVSQISGGMRRRLSMAAALVHNPELLFLDEPTAGIDPVLRRSFWDYFATLKDEGRTLFVTTQYVGEAAYCDYVGVMINGRLLTVGTPTELRRQALGGDVIQLKTETFLPPPLFNELKDQPFVTASNVTRKTNHTLHIVVDNASATIPTLLNWFQQKKVAVESINEYSLPFDDVFVKLVEKAKNEIFQNETQ